MSNVLGVVAEYNPFHNGHFYHLQESKQRANADSCICVISGNFTQRGEPSIINKWSKAYMAICGGADLVIELPVEYSISSAENFASGAVKILDSLKIVNTMSFGAECNDLDTLNNIANVICNEPTDYKTILNRELKTGISYPAAIENAIMMYLNDTKKYANILSNPNNILGIEYLKALKQNKSKIEPMLIKRNKVNYNEEKIVDNFASASTIRKLIERKEYSEVRKVVPKSTFKILEEELKKGNVILGLKRYEKEILYVLRKMSLEQITSLPDVSEGLQYSIKKAADECNTVDELIKNVKSKRYTQTRIQRILIYALLDINKKDIEDSKNTIPYARILAFNSKGRQLISKIMKANSNIYMITSVNKFIEENTQKESSEKMLKMLSKDILATDVYTLGYEYESKAKLDYTHNMMMIE